MLSSLIAITDRVFPGMRQRKWGRIIASMTSGVIAPIKNLAISNTLRAALLAWSKTLAAEVAAGGITVNIIMSVRGWQQIACVSLMRPVPIAKAKAMRMWLS
jgi:3-oxoacyl-[acyl-carrier protein] reductase